MVKIKRVFCLANSRKTSGRCIAGKEVQGNEFRGWIRPISGRPLHEISEEDRGYGDGTRAQVLDLIDICVVEGRPVAHQIENYLIDDTRYWVKVGEGGWPNIEAALDPVSSLWINGHHTYHGCHDKVPEDQLPYCGSSLHLIDVASLNIVVVREAIYQSTNTRKRVRASFDYCGLSYSLVVTDPVVEDEFLRREEGEYQLGRCIVCVSLSEVMYGHAYKLAATIFRRASFG